MEETNITNFEIASSPEELQASMDRETQQEPQNPVQEAAQEQAPEPVQETPYVDPELLHQSLSKRFRLSNHNKNNKRNMPTRISKVLFSTT